MVAAVLPMLATPSSAELRPTVLAAETRTEASKKLEI